MSIADIRTDYSQTELSESDTEANPITQFSKWFNEALTAAIPELNAMSLSTVAENSRPSSRIMLLKDFDQSGFTWYTNYGSRKGVELQRNPYAAILFHWIELEREVRIEGRVERVSAEESDKYFHSRPLKSRLGAHASAQSLPISDRETLEAQFDKVEAQYGDHPPRPAQWGGYRLTPDHFEFWQGRRSRMHDRIVYTLQKDGSWKRQRLQP